MCLLTDEENVQFMANFEFGLHVKAPEYTNAEKKCGMIGIRRDVATGGARYFTHRCNNFRDCKICFSHRKSVMLNKIERTIEHHGVTYLTEVFLEDDKQYRSYRDKYGSDRIIRFPVDNGTVLLIVDYDGDSSELNVVTVSDLKKHENYFNYLCMTPPNKKVSGGVKEQEEVVDEQETVEVSVTIFVFDASRAVVESLEKLAQQATKHLKPDKFSLQRAIIDRERALYDLAEAKSIPVYRLKTRHVERVKVQDICWKQLE